MVNKAVLSLAILVLLSAVGVGVLIGMQVGGSGPVAEPTPTPSPSPAATLTPTATAPASTPTPTATPETATDVQTDLPPQERTAIQAYQFNEFAITNYILQFVNETRQAQGLAPLSTRGRTVDSIGVMAKNHSESMARVGLTAHVVDGVSSADRYRANDLYGRCEFSVGGNYIETADNNQLEAVGRTIAGQSYQNRTGQQQFNADDRAVARAIVDNWLASDQYRDRLLYENAGLMNAGVTVTNRGTVYATINFCG